MFQRAESSMVIDFFLRPNALEFRSLIAFNIKVQTGPFCFQPVIAFFFSEHFTNFSYQSFM